MKGEQAEQAKQRCPGQRRLESAARVRSGRDRLQPRRRRRTRPERRDHRQIFNGGITNWNDPAIAALNSGVKLPDEKISPIVRSDSSGTSDNFQQYLEASSKGAWTQGAGSDFKGGVGEGAKARRASLRPSRRLPVRSRTREVVRRSAEAAGRADRHRFRPGGADAGDRVEGHRERVVQGLGHRDLTLDLKSIYGTQEAGAYPLVLATYEIVCSKGYDEATGNAVKSFLTSAANEGQQTLADQGYVPLPESFRAKINESISAIA
ncbi:hypothetical protein GS584_16415 [Rhodococcus hoagii]|nr:hypothetical protein [Prescottella equi]